MTMNIHIALCDDEKAEIDYLSLLVEKWAESRGIHAVLRHFASAESLLFHHPGCHGFDLLLLDIQMEGINGVELARKIRQDNDSVQIVFITGLPDFVAEGYDVSALHYLMKPVKEEKLSAVLDKARKNMDRAGKSLFLTIDGETHRIPFAEIRYVEAQGHYIVIRAATRTYTTKMNLSEIEKELGDGFFRCQRSYIVNLAFVRKITRAAVILDDRTEVPLSRNLYDAANQAVIAFF